MSALVRMGKALRARPKSAIAVLVLIGLAVTAAFVRVGSSGAPDLPTTEVTRGQFVDALEIRGDIRPLKSIVLSAPMQSGDLQIVKLAKNGSLVKTGRHRGRVRRVHAPPDDAGEAVGAEAGGSGDSAVDGAVPDHAGAERDRADALEVQRTARVARLEQGRHGLADRERTGED